MTRLRQARRVPSASVRTKPAPRSGAQADCVFSQGAGLASACAPGAASSVLDAAAFTHRGAGGGAALRTSAFGEAAVICCTAIALQMPFCASLSAQAGCIFVSAASSLLCVPDAAAGVNDVSAASSRASDAWLRKRFVCLLPQLSAFLCGRARIAVTSACVRMVTPFCAQAWSRAPRTSRASIERGKILPSSRSMRETPSPSMKRQSARLLCRYRQVRILFPFLP